MIEQIKRARRPLDWANQFQLTRWFRWESDETPYAWGCAGGIERRQRGHSSARPADHVTEQPTKECGRYHRAMGSHGMGVL
jgi:hypothetical protein